MSQNFQEYQAAGKRARLLGMKRTDCPGQLTATQRAHWVIGWECADTRFNKTLDKIAKEITTEDQTAREIAEKAGVCIRTFRGYVDRLKELGFEKRRIISKDARKVYWRRRA